MEKRTGKKLVSAAVAAALIGGWAACCSVKPSVDPNDVDPVLPIEETHKRPEAVDRTDDAEEAASEASNEQSSPESPLESDDPAYAIYEGASAQPEPSPTSPVCGEQEEAPRRWVEETEQMWIVDREAWSESIPVYETREVSVCNVCGVEITGNVSAHAKKHMLAGEGSGHRTEVVQILVGHETVERPEEGHWETVVVGGHWK